MTRLCRDHVELQGLVDDLLSRLSGPAAEEGVDGGRDRGTALLGRLSRHRQRGADLVFEAYQADFGGEA